MKHRLVVQALVVGLCVALAGLAAPALAQTTGHHASATAKKAHPKKARRKPKKPVKVVPANVFQVCKKGCRYARIQTAVNAAGAYQLSSGRHAIVTVGPGTYAEGVMVNGTLKNEKFDGLTIMGTSPDPHRTVLMGSSAKGAPQNGIEALSVDGIAIKSLWARNYQANGFFIHATTTDNAAQHCNGYTVNNVIGSENFLSGVFAKECFGGTITNSVGRHNGDAGFYVATTLCDSPSWSIHLEPPVPCQAKPRWTFLENDRAYENVIGYSGTNAKYVQIDHSMFYNNGTGIVPNALDPDPIEPDGWSIIENNDVFWNNYNYYLSGTAVRTASLGLGQLAGKTANYLIGVGILLYGSTGTVVRQNNVFGNDKWGIATASAAGEPPLLVDQGDDAKSVDNRVIENTMGRGGLDPNGVADFWNDGTGGGNCWAANSHAASFAPGNGRFPLSALYPPCASSVNDVDPNKVSSLNLGAGLQLNPLNPADPSTIVGYGTSTPPATQQCSWIRRVATHPPFNGLAPSEVTPKPGELPC